jgi:hypothetical protein
MATVDSTPLLPRSGEEGSGWGVPQQTRCQRSKPIDPPPPTPPRHTQGRVEGGEITVHEFAISPNNVIASASEAIHGAAKQVWIASSQVLLAMS